MVKPGLCKGRKSVRELCFVYWSAIVLDIYDVDILDFNFIKIRLQYHFTDHKEQFGKIQIDSTELREPSNKRMIKEGYQLFHRNNGSHQILWTYARLDSCKIREINIQADIVDVFEDEPCDKQDKRWVGLVTKQPRSFKLSVKSMPQCNQSLRNIQDDELNYYQQKSFMGKHINVDSVAEFAVELC